MTEELLKLKTIVLDNRIIGEQLLQTLEVVSSIEARYLAEFEKEWLRVHSQLSRLAEENPLGAEAKLVAEEIEGHGYQRVFGKTRNSEAAGLVCDDLELFILALELNYSDPWLNGVFKSYLDNQFPNGCIEPFAKEIRAQIKEFK